MDSLWAKTFGATLDGAEVTFLRLYRFFGKEQDTRRLHLLRRSVGPGFPQMGAWRPNASSEGCQGTATSLCCKHPLAEGTAGPPEGLSSFPKRLPAPKRLAALPSRPGDFFIFFRVVVFGVPSKADTVDHPRPLHWTSWTRLWQASTPSSQLHQRGCINGAASTGLNQQGCINRADQGTSRRPKDAPHKTHRTRRTINDH